MKVAELWMDKKNDRVFHVVGVSAGPPKSGIAVVSARILKGDQFKEDTMPEFINSVFPETGSMCRVLDGMTIGVVVDGRSLVRMQVYEGVFQYNGIPAKSIEWADDRNCFVMVAFNGTIIESRDGLTWWEKL